MRRVGDRPNPGGILLWDVDGTLVLPDRSAPAESGHAVVVTSQYGFAEPTVGETRGMTDYELVVSLVPVPYSLDPIEVTRLLQALDQHYVERSGRQQYVAVPGVRNCLEEAAARGWAHALLTGNTRSRAEMKLVEAGLVSSFDWELSFFGDRHLSRNDLCRVAVDYCRGSRGGFANVVVVGDSRRDIRSAKNAEVPIVATTAGGMTAQDLKEEGADLVAGKAGFEADVVMPFLDAMGFV
jgi:phosphoglycolate phosphatase